MTLTFNSPMPNHQHIREQSYKQGREDAAKAIIALILNKPEGSASLNEVIAAARGEA